VPKVDRAGESHQCGCRSLVGVDVEGEGDAHLLAIVADLDCVGAPAGVWPVDSAFAAVGLHEQLMSLHHPVDALRIRRCAAGLLGLPAQQGVDAAIAVGGQVDDEGADVGYQLGAGQRRSPVPFCSGGCAWRRDASG
jgi:hypothetical protein